MQLARCDSSSGSTIGVSFQTGLIASSNSRSRCLNQSSCRRQSVRFGVPERNSPAMLPTSQVESLVGTVKASLGSVANASNPIVEGELCRVQTPSGTPTKSRVFAEDPRFIVDIATRPAAFDCRTRSLSIACDSG
jgi:hypothetical protein